MNNKQHSITTIDCEVSFIAASTTDYGTIKVPKGTKVERHVVNGKLSDWFISEPEKVCPFKDLPHSLYMHDAKHYGIKIPNQNVAKV